MKNSVKNLLVWLVALTTIFGVLGAPLLAAKLENIQDTVEAQDYLVGPGKQEIWLNPGETVIKAITVTNRFGKERKFKIEIEDFGGSKDPAELVKLYGTEKGPYSLRDYLKPEVNFFTLNHGDRLTIPVQVSIPADAAPGGLYGAVIVTAEPLDKDISAKEQSTDSGLTIVSRIATLFFVRIRGEVKEEGQLKEFYSDKKIYGNPPINFTAVYENTGSVYTVPAGLVTVKNILGSVVGEIKADSMFVLPDSVRYKEMKLENKFMLGRYTASLKMIRGYSQNDVTDEKTITFWVLPWKVVGSLILALIVLILLLAGTKRWFNKNFERKKRG